MAKPNGGKAQDIVLRLSHITKRFGALTANGDISFALNRGEILALLGENGAGKTTLMNILFGHYVADEGDIEAFGSPLPPGDPAAAIAARIGMVHQHFALAENLTVLDNILLGTQSLWQLRLDTAPVRARLKSLSEDFGLAVNPDARVADLSVGERQRVEILKALYRDARILILDEPTAVLTPQESKSLFGTLSKLAEKGLSIIFISHKLHEVMEAATRILVLRQGKLVAERATPMTSKAELANLMVGREIAEPALTPSKPGAELLALQEITAPHLNRANLILREGEILGIAGVSGNGQQALADLISGLVTPVSGELRLYGKAATKFDPRAMVEQAVARIPEDRHAEGLIPAMTVSENVIAERYRNAPFSRAGFLNPQAAQDFARSIIKDYDVRCEGPEATTRLLSGGNMQKLILGRVLSLNPRIILANQPTRGLDVGAVAYVHDRLREARENRAGVLLISEDLDEILSLSDRIAVIYRGSLSEPVERRQVDVNTIGLQMAGGAHHAA
jgi:general nucleoside transport system ATP-binding protein